MATTMTTMMATAMRCSLRPDKIHSSADVRSTQASITRIAGMDRSSRLIVAAAPIAAPSQVVWDILTDYARLADHVPNLKENEVLERDDKHCRLRQVGEQDVALGFKFSAAVTVDVEEYPSGGALSDVLESDKFSKKDCFDWITDKTCVLSESPREILFKLVEGDFREFQGVWQMGDVANATDASAVQAVSDDSSSSCQTTTVLHYILRVKPQRWLPVRFVEGRIARDVEANLKAIRALAERRAGAAADA